MSAIPCKPIKRKNKGKMGPKPVPHKGNNRYYITNTTSHYLRRGHSTRYGVRRRTTITAEVEDALQEFVRFAKENKLTVHMWSSGHVLRPSLSSVIAKATELFLLQYSPNLWEWPPHTFDETAKDPFNSI